MKVLKFICLHIKRPKLLWLLAVVAFYGLMEKAAILDKRLSRWEFRTRFAFMVWRQLIILKLAKRLLKSINYNCKAEPIKYIEINNAFDIRS